MKDIKRKNVFCGAMRPLFNSGLRKVICVATMKSNNDAVICHLSRIRQR